MKNKRNLPQKSNGINFPVDISLNKVFSLAPSNGIVELYKRVSELKVELEATKEVEATKREYIAFLKEKALRDLEIFENVVNKIADTRIESIKKSIEKELKVIDIALERGDIEMLKAGLGTLVRTLESPILGEDLDKLNRALNGDSSVEIEI